MNRLKQSAPWVSCVSAMLALALALFCWAFAKGSSIEALAPIAALTSVFLTAVALVSGILGAVVTRRGPLIHGLCAWIGILLGGLGILFWSFIAFLIWRISSGDIL